jgi:hypothetical protein
VVAVDSGKYFRTCVDVIGGNPMSWSLSSALQNVSMVGKKGIGGCIVLFLLELLCDRCCCSHVFWLSRCQGKR